MSYDPPPSKEARVVNLHRTYDCDLLIDRRTPFGNPFHIGKDGTRGEVIEKYHRWILQQPHLIKKLPMLRGKVLGCWCKPFPCHGDVLVDLLNSLTDEEMGKWPKINP